MPNEGSFVELASRGKKDAFFIQNPEYTWFDGGAWEPRNPSARDVIYKYPLSPAQFGTTIEIELPRNADILKHFDIMITMPTWLPPGVAVQNFIRPIKLQAPLTNPSTGQPAFGCYGWSNGTADNVIDKWELYADTYKVAEGNGIINSSYWDSRTTHARAPLYHQSAGYHDGSTKAIQRAATLPQICCRIPLPGCQYEGGPGFPICAMLKQRLYVRLYIAPKERLVESSVLWVDFATQLPMFDSCPQPWGGHTILFKDSVTGQFVDSGYRTLQAWEMGQPEIFARCQVLQLEDEMRETLIARPLSMPYQRFVVDQLAFDETTWQIGNTVSKVLETCGFFDAIYVRFWHDARRRQNKYLDTLAPGGAEWVSTMSLVVNSVERVFSWNPTNLRKLANNSQLSRDIKDNYYFLVFGEPIDREPAGSLFLSRTHKSLLRFQIAALPTDPATHSRFVYVSLLGIAWNVLDIRDGQVRIRFAD